MRHIKSINLKLCYISTVHTNLSINRKKTRIRVQSHPCGTVGANIPVWWGCRHQSFRRLQRVLHGLFSPYLMFFIKANPRRVHSHQMRQLPCRARGTRAFMLFSHLPFRMDDFVHEFAFSFCKSIDWSVQYENNQTLDILITYVA